MIAGRNLGNCCPAYQLVTQLALSGCSTIRCVAPYNTAGNTLRSFIIRFSSSSSSSSWSSSVVACAAQSLLGGLRHVQPLSRKATTWFGRYSSPGWIPLRSSANKLVQTDLIWNFTIVVLPFLMQFFPPFPFLLLNIAVAAGRYERYCSKCHFALLKCQNGVFSVPNLPILYTPLQNEVVIFLRNYSV